MKSICILVWISISLKAGGAQVINGLQQAVELAAKKSMAGVGLGIHAPSLNLSLSLAAGQISPGVNASAADRFGWGSVTKTFTGAAILRLVADGKLSLDDKVASMVDPMLASYSYRSLEELFSVDGWYPAPPKYFNASLITVRDLLHMQAGVPDYDSEAFRHLQYTLSSVDFTPLQLFDFVHGGLLFEPGATPPSNKFGIQPGYSSMDFVLLGCVLAYHQNISLADWSQLDQSRILPVDMEDISFPNSGPYKEHLAPVRGYDRYSFAGRSQLPLGFDVSNVSAAGGWTAGNVIMPVLSASKWAFSLFGKNASVLPRNIVQQMKPKPGTVQHSYYGLATMNITGAFGGGSGAPPDWTAYGHLGATYGFSAAMVYFEDLDVAVSLAANVEMAQSHLIEALCLVYNLLLDVKNGGETRHCFFDTPTTNATFHLGGSCNCVTEVHI